MTNIEDIALEVDHFDLQKIAESGQCFRWEKISTDGYLVPAGQSCAFIWQEEPNSTVHLKIPEGELTEWQNYLSYGERYGDYISATRNASLADGTPDEFLRAAAAEADGVQILTQDLWETMVSFIISQNNNIPRIKRMIRTLCEHFGEKRDFCGVDYYTFPTPEQLAGKDLTGIGLGYRDQYIAELAQNVVDGRIDLHELPSMSTEDARTYLKSIFGIGDKVADCILLFGLNRIEAFPVDTWIKKIVAEKYAGKFPVEHYEGFAGIVQQFMFYYAQQHKGGRKK